LLSHNLPLFIQLQLAFGLFAAEENFQPTNHEDQILAKKKWMKNYQQKLHLEDFNSTCRLFTPGF
jgi:hypothetical protein